MALKVIALAGGVGGAKLADGLAMIQRPEDLTLVVNTGDDFNHLGLTICPDLDTVLYTLAGVANPESGWGREDETWTVMETLAELSGPTWFNLGDKDLGLHLYRSGRLSDGAALHEVTAELCGAFGVETTILPMSNDRVSTFVATQQGEFPFQEYFVALKWGPTVTGFRFEGAGDAAPAPGVLDAIASADAAILCPSNPWVSIDPILAVPGVRAALRDKLVLAVSPLIGGQALKGPAAKMYSDLGMGPSVMAIAHHYDDFLTVLFVDHLDSGHVNQIRALGIEPVVSEIVMGDRDDRRRLAQEVLDKANEMKEKQVRA